MDQIKERSLKAGLKRFYDQATTDPDKDWYLIESRDEYFIESDSPFIRNWEVVRAEYHPKG